MKISADGVRRFSIALRNAVATGVAVDASSNIYVCGATDGDTHTSSGVFLPGPFQTTPGVFQPSSGEGFVAKLDPEGKVLWASRLSARPHALALDASGAVYLTGMAKDNFRTTAGAVQPAMRPQQCSPDVYGSISHRSCTDAFIAKVSSDGARLLYASFLGGSREEFGNAIAVDAAGKVYVAGETYGCLTVFGKGALYSVSGSG